MSAVAILTLGRIRLSGGPLQRMLQMTGHECGHQRWRLQQKEEMIATITLPAM